MRLAELERWLYGRGFRLDRVRGAHRHYKHVASGYRLTISMHGRTLEREQVELVLRDLARMDSAS